MKLSINLATKPFVELRPLLVRLRIVMAALGVLAVALVIVWRVLAVHTAQDQAQMREVTQKTDAVLAQRNANENTMRQPGNAALLSESKYLNQLFARKAFSWTEVMMDMEQVLPAGVQVMSIDPQIDKTGAVTLKIHVSGDRVKAIEFVANLEQSKHFRDAHLSDETVQGQENQQNGRPVLTGASGVEFNVFAGYNPLPLHDVHAENTAEGVPTKSDKDASDKPAPKPSVKKPLQSKPKNLNSGVVGQGISRPTTVPTQAGTR